MAMRLALQKPQIPEHDTGAAAAFKHYVGMV